MKNLVFILLLSVALISCSKKDDTLSTTETVVGKEFTVDGYLISSRSKKPILPYAVAIAQSSTPKNGDPASMTDSTGYFKIVYKSQADTGYIYLHQALSDYSCVYSDINILKNLQKNKDLHLGTIYMEWLY